MGSPNGATAAANIYSLLEHKIDEGDAALIQKLMPWNPDLKNLIDKDFPPPSTENNTTDQKNNKK
ncbi:MAG: hypothetical protein FADNKDHG_01423 [Holosporales bacterium]